MPSSRLCFTGPVPGTKRPLLGLAVVSATYPAAMPYLSSNAISFSPSSGRLPRPAITQRPSLVCAMVGAGEIPSRAWRQVWRCTSDRRITHVIRSTSVDFATAS